MPRYYWFDQFLPDLRCGLCANDSFRMYCFKVEQCPLGRRHSWRKCPFLHAPHERSARRRHPRRHPYGRERCPDFYEARNCIRGDMCLYSHGAFERMLHPRWYRRSMCWHGDACARRPCFFAHGQNERRRGRNWGVQPDVNATKGEFLQLIRERLGSHRLHELILAPGDPQLSMYASLDLELP